MKTYFVQPKHMILSPAKLELDLRYVVVVRGDTADTEIARLKRQVAQYEDMLRKLPKTFPNENREEE